MQKSAVESDQGKMASIDQNASSQSESKLEDVRINDMKSDAPATVEESKHTGAEMELPVTQKDVHYSPEIGAGSGASASNPYDAAEPVLSTQFSIKDTLFTVKDVLGRWAKNVSEASKKAEVLAGNTWQHLRTSPSFADAAIGRIAQSTKVLAEGGYEKIFRHTFETEPDEKLVDSFACYLSTSAGPVMGVLFVSSEKLAFCSDSPIPYKTDERTEWSYYKVVIPLNQVKAVTPSSSNTNNGHVKYVQVVSFDNHDFWFMGYLKYDEAVKCLQDSVETRHLESI